MADPIPFANGTTAKLRAGDTVRHVASDETWVILADTGTMVMWAGWPPGMENRSHCAPTGRCTDAIHAATIAAAVKDKHPMLDIILRENGRAN